MRCDNCGQQIEDYSPDYTAVIHCDKCGKELATIKAYHELKPNVFIPQVFTQRHFKIHWMFCQDCLNGRTVDEE